MVEINNEEDGMIIVGDADSKISGVFISDDNIAVVIKAMVERLDMKSKGKLEEYMYG